jgi:hypothetical protein
MSDLNPQQELFLSYLFDKDSETRGDSIASAVIAGYERTYHARLVKHLRDDIRDRTLDSLTALASKAVSQMEDSLSENGSVPRGEVRLKAASDILDRMGAGKQAALDITSKDESISPLFVLPGKSDVEVDPDYDGIDINKE